MNIYQENVLDHYKNPRNFGKLQNPDIVTRESNVLCGDEIEFHLKLKDGKIVDLKFNGPGCAISRASASMLGEFIKGKTIEEVKKIKEEDQTGLIGIEINPVRMKCAMLSLKTLKNGIKKL